MRNAPKYEIWDKVRNKITLEVWEVVDIGTHGVELKLEDYQYWYIVEDISYENIEPV